jgi:hypothetical protein
MKLPRRTFLRLASGAGAFRAVSRNGWAQAMIDPMHWQEELLALNPWARELWGRRRELVQRKQWNLYYIDQGGNDATRRWLAEFQTARHKASRERLEAGKVSWNVWAERISAVITALRDAGLLDIGTPGTTTMSDRMPPYTRRFLTADVLLLVRADFYRAVIAAEADFGEMRFPGGADFRGAEIGAGARFDRAAFGDYTGFDGTPIATATSVPPAVIGKGTTFRRAEFGRWAGFTFARLEQGVDFTDASFGFAGAFSGARIGEDASFRKVRFGESFAFEGVSIGSRTRFDAARFADEARFGGAVFDGDVSFNDAVFEGSVSFHSAAGRRPSFEGTDFRGSNNPFAGAEFSQ